MEDSIVSFLNTTANQNRIMKLVDLTFSKLLEPNTDLERQFPAVNYPDSMLLFVKLKKSKPTIGNVIAAGQSIPNTRPRVTLTREKMSELLVGKQYLWTGLDYKIMNEIELNMAAGTPAAQATAVALKANLFGTVNDLIPGVMETGLKMAALIACTGACRYTDPRTGAEVDLDYSDSIVPGLLPSPLTGNQRWNQPATAQGLLDLEQHSNTYFLEHGDRPEELSMRWTTVRDLAAQNYSKAAWLSRTGAGSINAGATESLYLRDEAIIEMIVERTKIKRVTIIDNRYTEEVDDSHAEVTSYFIPDDTYYFHNPGNIERSVIPIAEKGFKPGIFTLNETVSRAPLVSRSLAMAGVVPTCFDPTRLAARQVFS